MAFKIPGVYVDFKGDLTELKKDYRKAADGAKQAATDISNNMKNAVLPNTVTRSFNQLYQDLTKINRVATVTAADMKKLGVTLDKDLLKNLNLSEQEFLKLQRRMLNTKATQQAERAIKSLGKAANLTTLEMAMLRRKVGDTRGAMRTLATATTSTFRNIAGPIAAATVAMTALAYAAGRVSKMIWDTGVTVRSNTKAMEEVAGSTAAAAAEMEWLRQVADKLKLNFYELLPTYKNFYTATKLSGMAGKDTRIVYEGITKAIATMGLTADKSRRVLRALEQMVSKGMRGIAEDLSQQMGEALPGALGLFAKSVGVTGAELRKMMEQGKLTLDDLVKFGTYMGNTFSGEIDSAIGASNQFNQAWMDLKGEMADSGFMDSATTSLNNLTEAFKDPEVKESMADMAWMLGQILEVSSSLVKLWPKLRDALSYGGDTTSAGWGAIKEPKLYPIPARKGAEPDEGTSTPLPEDLPFEKQIKQTPDPWGKSYDTDYGNDAVAAAIQMRELALNNERIALKKNIALQNRMAEAIEDTYDLDKGSDDDGLADMQADFEARESILESFQSDYKQATMTTTEYELDQLSQRYDAYSKTITDKTKLDEWYAAEQKNIIEDNTTDWSEAFSGWAASYSRTLNDMILDSEFSFKTIGESFARMLTEMQMQEAMSGIMDSVDGINWGGLASSVFGGMFGGGSFTNSAAMNVGGSIRMAGGGIINEHVVGVGMTSGASYEFGEAGVPEAVVPKNSWGGKSSGGTGGQQTKSTIVHQTFYVSPDERGNISKKSQHQIARAASRGMNMAMGR